MLVDLWFLFVIVMQYAKFNTLLSIKGQNNFVNFQNQQ